jgi:kynureninase
VALAHPDAWRISQALIALAGVVPDFRPPDRIRLGPAPIATRFVEVWDALDRLRRLVEGGAHERHVPAQRRVT